MKSYKQFYVRCQQKLDRINHRSILGDPGLETVRHAVSPDLTVKDSEQSLVCYIKMLQFTDFREEERLLVPTLLKDDGLEVDPNTVLWIS